MKILHTADVHLSEVNDNQWQALKQIIELGNQKKVDVLVIAGDLFDKNFQAGLLKDKLRNLFNRAEFPILILPGNHDVDGFQSGDYFGEKVTVINNWQQPIEIKGVNFWGMPFENLSSQQMFERLKLMNEEIDANEDNVLIYHGELTDQFFNREDFGEEGQKRYMPVQGMFFKDLDFNYVLAGHFHRQFTIRNYGSCYFVYPGSPASVTKKEIGPRKVNLLEFGQQPQEKVLESFYFHPIVVTLNPDQDEVFNLIEKKLDQTPDYCCPLITVQGYFNQEKIDMDEAELVKKIKKLTQDYQAELNPAEPEVKNISRILESDLYHLFKQQLEEEDSEKQERTKEMFLKAAMRLDQ